MNRPRLSSFLLLLPALALAQIPPVEPPGQPHVGILEQHLTKPDNFIEVYEDFGAAKYFFNQATVKNNTVDGEIKLWFLIEYSDDGRKALLGEMRSEGKSTQGLESLRYSYYEMSLAYLHPLSLEPLNIRDYSYLVLPGGEACDSRGKILAYVQPTERYMQIDKEREEYYLFLAAELEQRYRLK